MSKATYNDWLHFIESDTDPDIRDIIKESWKSSKNYSVPPCGTPVNKNNDIDVSSTDFKQFETTRNFIESRLKSIPVKNIAYIICDTESRIVFTDARSQLVKDVMEQLKFSRGVMLNEESAGTNALSLAIKKGAPSFCNGPEHYIKALHPFSSAAAPYFNLHGEKQGFIMLVGLFPETRGSFLLGYISLITQILEYDRRINFIRRKLNTQRKITVNLTDSISEPLLMITRRGKIVRRINEAARRLFKLKDGVELSEEELDSLFKFSPKISDITKDSIKRTKEKISIELPGKKITATYDKQPIFDENEYFVAVMLTFDVKSDSSEKVAKPSVPEAKYDFDDIIGDTPGIKMARQLGKRAAETSINVLITGESGTGKEMFAQSIHNAGERKGKPFISINCAAIPREIAESELFGYAPGSFTGAAKEGKPGKLESAHGGTVFLDEIGDMPFELQSKLLRVLEERTITRIGDTKEIPIDIRIIAATNRNITQLFDKNKFREDLYYRLSVTSIYLPALRESKRDIPVLVKSFIDYFNEMMGKNIEGVNPKVLEKLMDYQWPGNIRELRNTIEHAVMFNPGDDLIDWEDIPGNLRAELLYSSPIPNSNEQEDYLSEERNGIEESEKKLYQKAIKVAKGNLSQAARDLKIGRATLYRKLKKLGIRT